MNFLITLLFIIEAIVALLMVAVVMLQPPKDQSGGMGSAFGGGFGEEVFGGRTGNVLSRATVILGIVLIVNTLAIGLLMCKRVSNTGVRGIPAPVEAPAAPAETPAQ